MDKATKIERGKWYVCNQECENELPKQYIKGRVYECVSDGSLKGEDMCSRLLYDTGAEFHKWTIEDAHNGDVLAYPDGTLTIFKFRVVDEGLYVAHCVVSKVFESSNTCAILNVRPATRNEIETLKERLDAEGFKWNSEKKSLDKISFLEMNDNGDEVTFEMFGKKLKIIEGAHPGHNWCTMCALDDLCESVKFPKTIGLPCRNANGESNRRYFVEVKEN